MLYGLPESMEPVLVMEEMWRRVGATEEDPRPYLKTVLCRIVSIAMVGRRVEEGEVRLQLNSLPSGNEGEIGEVDLVSRFLDGLGKHQPQLVGYNSGAADLRILVQRGVAAGISAPGFAQRPDKPWEGGDYFGGSDWHVDLFEILGGRGRGRPSLHEMATVCGIPGKISESGADVMNLRLAGDIGRIVAYNELDVLTTYLLWFRAACFAGVFNGRRTRARAGNGGTAPAKGIGATRTGQPSDISGRMDTATSILSTNTHNHTQTRKIVDM